MYSSISTACCFLLFLTPPQNVSTPLPRHIFTRQFLSKVDAGRRALSSEKLSIVCTLSKISVLTTLDTERSIPRPVHFSPKRTQWVQSEKAQAKWGFDCRLPSMPYGDGYKLHPSVVGTHAQRRDHLRGLRRPTNTSPATRPPRPPPPLAPPPRPPHRKHVTTVPTIALPTPPLPVLPPSSSIGPAASSSSPQTCCHGFYHRPSHAASTRAPSSSSIDTAAFDITCCHYDGHEND